jgi:hypothetical protein
MWLGNLTEAEFVSAFKRSSATAADHGAAIATGERVTDGRSALRTIKLRLQSFGRFGHPLHRGVRFRVSKHHLKLAVVCAVCVAFLAACTKDSANKTPVIGTAFAGPIALNLRAEISPAAKAIAVAKHGDKLDIIQIRRRFVRVRTPDGKEGWTDSRNLLSAKQMEDLKELAERSKKLPVQGQATVYGTLNMHPEPRADPRPSTRSRKAFVLTCSPTRCPLRRPHPPPHAISI